MSTVVPACVRASDRTLLLQRDASPPPRAQVAEGSYLLEVYDTQRAWPTVRVEVGQAISGTVRATRTHDRLQLSTPMQLAPLLQDRKFFEERPSFQWSSLFMNPMVIMMLVSGGIMFVMPKMMANIDPEELKKMTEMQNAQSSLSFSDLLNPDKLKEKAALLDDTKGKKGKAK